MHREAAGRSGDLDRKGGLIDVAVGIGRWCRIEGCQWVDESCVSDSQPCAHSTPTTLTTTRSATTLPRPRVQPAQARALGPGRRAPRRSLPEQATAAVRRCSGRSTDGTDGRTDGRTSGLLACLYRIVRSRSKHRCRPQVLSNNDNNNNTDRADELASAIVRDLETLHLAGGAAGGAGGMSASVLFDFGDAARQLRMLILLGKVREGSRGMYVCR